MKWRDVVELAATGVRRRAGRAVLTVLAVALATAMLTALVAIAGTARTRVLSQLAKGGPLAGIRVAAAAPNPTQVDRDDARPGRQRRLDDASIDRMRGLRGVDSVIPVLSSRVIVQLADTPFDETVLRRLRARKTDESTRRAQSGRGLRIGPSVISDTLVGVPMEEVPNLPITVLAGRVPIPGSATEVAVSQGYLGRIGLQRSEADAVVGTEVVIGSGRSSFGPNRRPTVQLRWSRAVIVGVVIQEAAPGQFLMPDAAVRAHRDWSAAGTGFREEGDLLTSSYVGAFVLAEGLDQIGPVRARIATVGFATSAPENLIASVQRYLGVVEIVLSAIGLIAVGIAALGITNALFAAVRERRREIGVLKAIGARDRDVLRVFLLEAAVLGFIGGVLGSAGGWAMAWTVARVVNRYLAEQSLPGVALPFPVLLFIAAILGSTVLAVVAGTFPALRAARLPAREAVAAG